MNRNRYSDESASGIRADGPDVNALISQLSDSFRPAGLSSAAGALLVHTARLLADGRRVSPQDVAGASARGLDETGRVLSELEAVGLVLKDDGGQIEGAVGLSLDRTRHRFEVGGRELFTWCALDALFLPAVLERVATVDSTCPVSKKAVKLVVSPESIERMEPLTTVVSFVVPGLTPGVPACELSACAPAGSARAGVGGPEGSFCTQVHFFVSERAGSEWVAGHPGALLLPADTAFGIGRDALAQPLLEAL